tara:strand:+ start:686 stop:946 length:261 start_codon:yes stop_codon:yes gene_type:complete
MTLIEMLKRYEKTLPDSQKRDLLGQAAERIADLEETIDEMVAIAAAKHRPAYDAQQQRIAELEAAKADALKLITKHTPLAKEQARG